LEQLPLAAADRAVGGQAHADRRHRNAEPAAQPESRRHDGTDGDQHGAYSRRVRDLPALLPDGPDGRFGEIMIDNDTGGPAMTGAVYPGIRGQVVFVSGGASGIGAAIVTQFTRQGAQVAFVDIDDAKAE